MKWNREDYQSWLMQQRSGTSPAVRMDENTIEFRHEKMTGTVKIYPQDIVELAIADSQGENHFYLHFRLEDAEHAQDLTNEMLNVLNSLKDRHELRILLSCTSALTTSYFAQQLNEAVRVLKLDYIFEAVSFDHIYEKGFDFDVILLAPQIGFEYPRVKEIFQDQLVLKIPSPIFGQYDTGGMIELIRKEYNRRIEEGVPEENTSLRSVYDNPYRILTICVINHSDGNRFGYRIYDHGQKTLDKEVIKPDAGIQDMFDLLDYVLARHKNIDYIGISVPGVINKGTVDEPRFGYFGDNLSRQIYRKYHMRSSIINDVDAMALGYHAMHEDFDNMVFFFMPRGLEGGGAGVIIDGRLHRGYKYMSGEVGRLTDAVIPAADKMVFSPDGIMKIVTVSLLAYIVTIAPEKIVYYSELTPNEEAVKKSISRYIKPEYVPELIHVSRLKRYQLPGTMIRCLEVMKYDRENPGWWDHIMDEEKQ